MLNKKHAEFYYRSKYNKLHFLPGSFNLDLFSFVFTFLNEKISMGYIIHTTESITSPYCFDYVVHFVWETVNRTEGIEFLQSDWNSTIQGF